MEANVRWMAITALAPIAWGTNYYLTRHYLPVGYPLYGAAIRALPAGLLLMAVSPSLPRGSWWWKSAVLGVLNMGAFFVLVYVAGELLPSGVAATLMASSAIVMMLLAWPLLGARPKMTALVGALTGLVGVGVMLTSAAHPVHTEGVLASLVAMLSSSIGFVLTKRWRPEVSTLTLTSWQLVAGGLFVTPVAILAEGGPPRLGTHALLGFSYLSLVATALAYSAWFAGLRHLDAGTVGLIGLLNPVTGVLLGSLAASEPFGARQIAGTTLVIVGVAVGRPRSVRRSRQIIPARA